VTTIRWWSLSARSPDRRTLNLSPVTVRSVKPWRPFRSIFGRCQVDELWSGDLAVLMKVAELYEGTGESLEPLEQLLEFFPADQRDAVRQSLRRLGDHSYIDTVTTAGMGQPSQIVRINRVTEKGLRATGAWPDDAELLADRVLAALVERAENEPDPEKQSKIKTALKAVGGMSRDVLVDVLGTAIKSTIVG
jgi:hypothetical protein